jgi:phosphate starvation-inducible PhoH-like protein
MAVKALKKKVKRIILTRPAVEGGKTWISSGDMKEKLDHIQPLYDALRDMLPNEKLEDYILKGIIQMLRLPSCEDELSIMLL